MANIAAGAAKVFQEAKQEWTVTRHFVVNDHLVENE